MEKQAQTAVVVFKSSNEYTYALVEESGDDYAEGYRDAKNIGVAFPELDLSGFPTEDKDETAQDSPAHSTAGD